MPFPVLNHDHNYPLAKYKDIIIIEIMPAFVTNIRFISYLGSSKDHCKHLSVS